MAIRVEQDDVTFDTVIVVAPAGEYGYGTIGQASPATTFAQSWRELQRAGLTKAVDPKSRRLRTWNAGCAVEYRVPGADAFARIPAKYFR